MARSKALARFSVELVKGTYEMRIEDDGGETLQLSATREQIELIADTLDDLLSEDDDADQVNGASDDDDED